MLADLHVHTYFSDSTRSPEEVARVAREQGIGCIATCDHNTVEAHARAAVACAAEGVLYLPAVEIDAAYEAGTQHVLAYGCDFVHPPLAALLAENLRIMEQVSIDLIERMRADDPRLDPAEYAGFLRNPSRGGWKGVDYLRGKGYKIEYPGCMALYRRYGCGPSAFQPVEEVARLIHEAGGVAILAHPGDRLPAEGLLSHVERLTALGIDGVECYYPAHSTELIQALIAFCIARGLCITAGGDDHGSFAEYTEGVHYALGELRVDTRLLRLAGLPE